MGVEYINSLNDYFNRSTEGSDDCDKCENECFCDREPEQCESVDNKTIGARKEDKGKLRYDLVPTYALEGIVKVITYGAIKYGDNNWQGVRPADRYFAAAQRHLMEIRKGEHVDPESGLKHLDHAITSLMMYRELLYNTDKHV